MNRFKKLRGGRHPLFRFLLPAVPAAAVLYAVFAPARFVMGDGYLLCSAGSGGERSEIRDPGGKCLAGPARIRVWGNYPWVYGFTDDPSCAKFILNLKEHTFQAFPRDSGEYHPYDDFDRFMGEHGFSAEWPLEWRELYADGDAAVQRRRQLRQALMPPPSRGRNAF